MRDTMNNQEMNFKANNLPSKDMALLCDILKRIVEGNEQTAEIEDEEEREETMMVNESVGTQAKRCYTVKDVQEILGISRPTVYELLKKKEFRWILIGTKYRISKQSFDEWLDKKMEG